MTDNLIQTVDQEHRPSRAEAEQAVRTLLRWTGDDQTREGLIGTPGRVARAQSGARAIGSPAARFARDAVRAA